MVLDSMVINTHCGNGSTCTKHGLEDLNTGSACKVIMKFVNTALLSNIGLLACIAVLAPGVKAQNIVANGSFEMVRGSNTIIGQTGTNNTLGYMTMALNGATTTDTRLDGWTIKFAGVGASTNFGIEIIRTTWGYTDIAGVATNAGNQSICLNANASGAIVQNIDVVAGTRYSLDYWRSASPSGFPSSDGTVNRIAIYDVTIDGSPMTVDTDNMALNTNNYVNALGTTRSRLLSDMGWERVHHEWVAPQTATVELGFVSQNIGGYGIALDDIQMRAMTTDTAAPVTTATQSPVAASGVWNNQSVTLTLTSTDGETGSQVKEIHYAINQGTEVVVTGGTSQTLFTESGSYSVAYWAVDYAGNIEATKYTTVRVDKIAPSTTLTKVGQQVQLAATDAHSGVSKTYYRLMGGPAIEYTAPFLTDVHSIEYWSEDSVGNVEGTKTQILNPAVQNLTAQVGRAPGGVGVVGTITLSEAAPVGGTAVALASSATEVSVPISVTVPAGQTSTTFFMQTVPVVSEVTAVVTATAHDTSASILLTVVSPLPSHLSLSSNSVTSRVDVTGTVYLSSVAPVGGILLSLASSVAEATVPASLLIPEGKISGTFTIATTPITSATQAEISATYSGVRASATLTLNPLTVTGLTINPTSISGGDTASATITISDTAPAGGTVVALASNNAAAGVPASVTVAAGETTATFDVTTTQTNTDALATVEATLNGASSTADITVLSTALSSLTLDVSSVSGGVSATGTVTIANAAPAAGYVVTLTSSSDKVTIPASVTIAAGQTSATFQATTVAVASDVTSTITASANGVDKTSTLTVTAPGIATFAISPTSVSGGNTATATITISDAAPVGGLTIALSSNNAAAGVPASVTVAAGETTATFDVTTTQTNTDALATVEATLNGASSTADITVLSTALSSLTLDVSSVSGGASATGTVTIANAAPAAGYVVTLTSSSDKVTIPASVTIAAGQTSATFQATTVSVASDVTSTITASANGIDKTSNLTVTAPGIATFAISPTSVSGGDMAMATLTISDPAPVGGLTIALSSNNAAAGVPASVTVAAGETVATFDVTTTQTNTDAISTIEATLNGASTTANLTVLGTGLSSVILDVSSVSGGASATGTVTIANPAPASGYVVTLSSSSDKVTIPASVTIAAGQTSATFQATTVAVASDVTSTITASANGIDKTSNLTVKAPSIASFATDPASITGGNSVTATITLSDPAPVGGLTIALSSNNGAVSVPVAITVAAGETTATFDVNTSNVLVPQAVNISATLNGSISNAPLTVNPLLVTSVTVSSQSVAGGVSTTGTLTMSGPAPVGGISVVLSSSNGAASVPATVNIAAGQTTGVFPVTTTAVALDTSALITAAFNSQSQTVSVGITAPLLNALTLSQMQVNGGGWVTATVTITSPAPVGGLTIALASTSASAIVQPTVTILQGETSGTFTVAATTVPTVTVASIRATLGNIVDSVSLTITPVTQPVTLTSVTVDPASVVGGMGVTGTVTLSEPAPAGGASVSLTSSSVSAKVSTVVVVPQGATTATFPITTNAVTAVFSVNIGGTIGAVTQKAVLQITPTAAPVSLTLSPTTVKRGSSSTATVVLNAAAPAGGTRVTLSSSKTTAATVLASVTVPAGSRTATFTVSTKAASAATTSTIKVTASAVSKTAVLSVTR